MNHWPREIKIKARELRKNGLSYGELIKRLNVSKSTLHSWIYDLKRPQYITEEQKRKHLENIRPLASIAIKKQKEDGLNKVKDRVNREVRDYLLLKNKDYLKSILSMLYWAEGAKCRGAISFVNTDPKLVLLFLTLFRKCYPINEDKLRVRLHLHYYHKIKETKSFWSNLLNISEAKFGKIYIKPRSKTKKFRQNFMGICSIRYHNEDLKNEILERAYLLADLINKNQVPVA